MTAPPRTIEIRPPSVRVETLNVLKAAAAIVVIVAAYLFRPSFGDQSQSPIENRQLACFRIND